MLKLMDTTSSLGNLRNIKCAEVFCQSVDNFSIVCTHCDLKIFEFNDFLLHFRNVHLVWGDDQDKLRNTIIKKEIDVTEDSFHNYADALQEVKKIPVDIQSSTPSDDVEDDVEVLHKVVGNDWVAEDNSDQLIDSDDESVYEEDVDQSNADNTDDEYLIKVLLPIKSKKVHNCSECDKHFATARSLKHHNGLKHNKVLLHPCDQCSEKFGTERSLQSHKQRIHIGFICTQCDRTYKRSDALRVHILTHHKAVKDYVCDFADCDKAFHTKSRLTMHKKNHMGESNFVCEVCGYRTRNKHTLTVHKRTHTGEKPYSCQVCGKGFNSSSALLEHKPVHSKERPHKCLVCSAAFATPKALYHHKHLHLDVKKFVCKVCGKAYAQAAGLSGHMRQHKIENMVV